MALAKPHANEPGHYRSKKTSHGWFVVLDYPMRLSKGGSPLPTEAPWVLWHPSTGKVAGLNTRKDACNALDDVVAGQDVCGLLTAIHGAAPSELSCVTESQKDQEEGSPAPARATDFSTGFMRAMQDRFPDALLFDRLEDAMTACTVASCEGVKYWRPDWGVRLKALETAIAYLIGRPIERQQIMQSNAPASWNDIMKLAQGSSVFRETLMSMLREMEQGPVHEAR